MPCATLNRQREHALKQAWTGEGGAAMAAQKQRRGSGPGEDHNVALGPHNRQQSARRPAVCLSRGARRVVPRIRD